MARSGKGTRRLAPGSFLDPLWEEGAKEGLWLEHRIVRSLLTTRKKKRKQKHVRTARLKEAGLGSGSRAMGSFIQLWESKGRGRPPQSSQCPSSSSKLGS